MDRFLTRLGRRRDEFLQEHFGVAWGWYERLTGLCSAGLVHAWRGRCVRECRVQPGHRVLDVATGTGGLLARYLSHSIVDALTPAQLDDQFRSAGFTVEEERPLCAGIVWLFVARPVAKSAAVPAPQWGGAAT